MSLLACSSHFLSQSVPSFLYILIPERSISPFSWSIYYWPKPHQIKSQSKGGCQKARKTRRKWWGMSNYTKLNRKSAVTDMIDLWIQRSGERYNMWNLKILSERKNKYQTKAPENWLKIHWLIMISMYTDLSAYMAALEQFRGYSEARFNCKVT